MVVVGLFGPALLGKLGPRKLLFLGATGCVETRVRAPCLRSLLTLPLSTCPLSAAMRRSQSLQRLPRLSADTALTL